MRPPRSTLPDPLVPYRTLCRYEWLCGLMANRYPGLVIEAMETVDLHNSHTTNLRVAVEYNAVGKAAGLPAHLCLKANWSGLTINNNTDICELEAREIGRAHV